MWISVDIEADGPIPGDYSMTEFGAVAIDKNGKLDKTFHGKMKPISDKWIPEALAVSGRTREETLEFEDPKVVMERFADWLPTGRHIFMSDNNGFDWQFINWYFHHFTGKNPFGFSSQNLGSIYKGLVGTSFKNFKHLRRTKHTHNPVDDATGNAEAFLHMVDKMDYKVKL